MPGPSLFMKRFYAIMLVTQHNPPQSLAVFRHVPTHKEINYVLMNKMPRPVPVPYMYDSKPSLTVVPIDIHSHLFFP
jgi:hypothetical protein